LELVEVVRFGQTHQFLKHLVQRVLFQVFQHMKLPVVERVRDIRPVQDLPMVALWSTSNLLRVDRVAVVPAHKVVARPFNNGLTVRVVILRALLLFKETTAAMDL
jgi:hypothetical protein